MFTVTAFGDEISADLSEQLDLLQSEGIRYLDLRSVWGKNVLDLSDAEAARVQEELARRGCGVSTIASPIGKIGIEEPFEPHIARFRRALDLAEFLAAPYIRIFSFYVPKGQAAQYRGQVMARLEALAEAAAGRKVMIGHENERGIYGDLPNRCLDIICTVKSPQWKTIFDPANYVLDEVHPFTDAFPLLADTIGYVHVKDAHMAEGTICPAGEGDGQVRQVLTALAQRGFDGFLSVEPHLYRASKVGGQNRSDLFRKAIHALQAILDDLTSSQ